MADEPLLELKNITTISPTKRGEVRAMDAVNLVLPKGEILGIVGESGCGKSTALLTILRLIRKPGYIANGEILYRDENIRGLSSQKMREIRGKEISMIFQDPLSTLNPAFPVGEQIRESLLTAAQRLGHQVADRLIEVPLEAVEDVAYADGRLQVLTEGGNQISGQLGIKVGDYDLQCDLGGEGLFPETEAEAFAARFRQVKPLYAQYLEQVGVEA